MLINTDKVRLLTAQQGMNLSKLAEKAGVSRQTLSTTMTRGSCRTETVMKLCDALSIDTSDIVIPNAILAGRLRT